MSVNPQQIISRIEPGTSNLRQRIDAVNEMCEAFPGAPDLYDKELMTGRGRGKYCYRPEIRTEAEHFLRAEVKRILGDVRILYIS